MRPILLQACVVICAFGQSPVFEVASIRPVPADAQCGMIQPMPGGGLRVECLSLKTIIVYAWDVQNDQLTGGPPWAESMRWTIIAKPSASDAPAAAETDYSRMTDAERGEFMSLARRRLQALLTERFQLVVRREMKDETTFSLTVAKNGPRLHESADGAGPLMKRGRGAITGKGARMPELARFLAIDLRRRVTDRTGLTGRYDFDLQWTPDIPGTAAPEAADDSGPSLFTAIQEQLGLRLIAQKEPVETIVIVSAALPSGN
jgi:bla regulator protein blaR1